MSQIWLSSRTFKKSALKNEKSKINFAFRTVSWKIDFLSQLQISILSPKCSKNVFQNHLNCEFVIFDKQPATIKKIVFEIKSIYAPINRFRKPQHAAELVEKSKIDTQVSLWISTADKYFTYGEISTLSISHRTNKCNILTFKHFLLEKNIKAQFLGRN